MVVCDGGSENHKGTDEETCIQCTTLGDRSGGDDRRILDDSRLLVEMTVPHLIELVGCCNDRVTTVLVGV